MFKRKNKRNEIKKAIEKAENSGGCIYLVESELGTRLVVVGRPLMLRQLDEILKAKGVI